MLTHLLLMRHAKSSWKDDTLPDHARPLNKRGRREADAVAQTLSAKGYAPDLIWASDAARTSETAARLIRLIPGAQTILKVPEFYHANAATVLQACAKQNAPTGRLMLLGHNPGWSELAEYWTGVSIDMPTACCLIFKHIGADKDNWISQDNWRLIDQIKAQDLSLQADSDGQCNLS